MLKPSVGRIVHYVSGDGSHLPAIITKVWSVTALCTVNLTVFSDGYQPALGMTSVILDEESKKVGTYHWPEREDG